MRSSPSYWDRAAADYRLGREAFAPDAAYRWRVDRDVCVGVDDLGDLDGRVLVELGCGHGAILRFLATSFPGGIFSGIDFSPAQLELARQETRRNANVRYLLWDARLGLPEGLAPFDDLLSVYGAVDFSVDPVSMLDTFLAGLRPGGMCTILTSTEQVSVAAVGHPRLDVKRAEKLGSHRFVRAVLKP